MNFKRLAWMLGLLGLVSVHSDASGNDPYPAIDSDNAASQSYELRRLLCKSCGQVVDLVYLPERESFFASTRSGDLWQISRRGQVVDVLRGQGAMPDSGIYFGPQAYIDWVFSGEKEPKAYRAMVDADHLSEDAFNAQLQAAETHIVRRTGEPGRAHYYLRENDGWRRLTRDYEVDLEQMYMRQPKDTSSHHPIADENDDAGLPFQRIDPVSTPIDYDWRDTQNPLYLHDYQRQGRVRRPFLDFNNHGWRGTYGRGQFRLRHRDEVVSFSALHRVSTEGRNSDAPDIDHYRLPEDHPAASIGFLGLYGRRDRLAENEPGFYVVRPKDGQSTDQATPASLHQQYAWYPLFAGFAQQTGTLRHMVFVNGQDESPSAGLHNTLAEKPRPVPLRWDFFHTLPGRASSEYIYLKLNQDFYFLRPRSLSAGRNFYVGLRFDEMETRAAFEQLQQSASAEDAGALITLTLDAEWLTEGLVYNLALQRGDERVPLHKARIERHSTLDDIPRSYVVDRLVQARDQAMADSSFDTKFMAKAGRLAQKAPEDSELAEAFASASVKLMIARLQKHNADAAEAFFYHYIDQVLPHTGFHPKALDVASNALVLGIVHKRPSVIDTTFARLLGGEDMAIAELRNPVLLYNLACLYAVRQNKPKMLEAARWAVELGKKPEQFLADDDFKAYWQDKDFLSTIHAR